MALPISPPIPAVTAMASAPQKPTLSAGFTIGAPLAQAPSAARKTNAAGGDGFNDGALRREKRRQRRRRFAERERKRRCERGLGSVWAGRARPSEIVARMGVERVLGHELISDLLGELRFQAPLFADMGKLFFLLDRLLAERASLARHGSGPGGGFGGGRHKIA